MLASNATDSEITGIQQDDNRSKVEMPDIPEELKDKQFFRMRWDRLFVKLKSRAKTIAHYQSLGNRAEFLTRPEQEGLIVWA